MITRLFNSVSNFFKGFEGCERVDVSLGCLEIKSVTAKAELVAKELKWLDNAENRELIKSEPCLMQYEFSKKLVWFVYFTHYFTKKERENDYKGVKSMSFAVVRVDDSTSKVIFADYIRPILTQDYED